MALSLDKIKALIRLANNNPSENEANLAARKVCKILAENDFALLRPNVTYDRVGAPSGDVKSDDIFKDIFDMMRKARQHHSNYSGGAGTWTGFDRSKEPNFRSKPPNQEPKKEYKKEGYARTTTETHETWKGGFRPSQAQEDFFRNAPRVDFTGEGSWWHEPRPNPGPDHEYDSEGKRVRKSATRKCSKCGFEVSTFRIKEEPFVCNPCHWKEYP